MVENLQKIKKIIAKHDEFFFCIIYFIIIFGIDIYIETVPTDEMWNFQNIYKMYNGYKIYIDVNVITTPLFHIIGVIIFKLFGANFFVFRIYGIIINLFLMLGVYKIFKALKIPKYVALLLTNIMFIASINVIHNTSNYNNMCLVFAIYGMLIIFNRKKHTDNMFILKEAIMSFIILATKQNIGIFYIIGFLIYCLLYEKNNSKIRNIFKYIGFVLFFAIISVIIMFKCEILEGFISYAILGIKEFAVKNFFSRGIYLIRLIGMIIIDIIFVIVFNFNKNKILNDEEIKNINIIACFSFPFIMIAYPIFNTAHIDIALVLTYMLLLYNIYLLFNSLLTNNVICKLIVGLIMILSIISIIRIALYLYKIDYNYSYDNIYFGSLLSNENKIKIDKITDYIKKSEEDVIVFSTEAAMYMMPLGKSNGNMDEPLLGNFGKDGEQGVIERISNMNNTIIIIDESIRNEKGEKKIGQESDKIREYIKNNLYYIGKIENMLIYHTIE